jgi:hypothetical protein
MSLKFDASRVLEMLEGRDSSEFREPRGAERALRFAWTRLTEMGRLVEGLAEDDDPGGEPARGFIARSSRVIPSTCRVVILSAPAIRPGFAAAKRRGRLGSWLKPRGSTEDSDLEVPSPASLSGLAFSLELARVWHESRQSRPELVVALADDRDPRQPVLQSLIKRIDPATTRIPTLLIVPIAPGIGQALTIVGGRTSDLAIEAARSLWIPVSEPRAVAKVERSWPLSAVRSIPDHLVVIGSGIDAAGQQTPAPDALNRAAQLVFEVALRWTKRIGDQSEGLAEDSRSDARSSQKPG